MCFFNDQSESFWILFIIFNYYVKKLIYVFWTWLCYIIIYIFFEFYFDKYISILKTIYFFESTTKKIQSKITKLKLAKKSPAKISFESCAKKHHQKKQNQNFSARKKYPKLFFDFDTRRFFWHQKKCCTTLSRQIFQKKLNTKKILSKFNFNFFLFLVKCCF